jgi:UDP-N-acetylmuramoyl-tripeptide--D-alanyl-D-alanine ligase
MLRLVTMPANALSVARARAANLVRRTDGQIRKWRAIYARRRSSATYVAVTGSSAKSTTTGLIAHILSGVTPVRALVTTNILRVHVNSLQHPPPDHGYFVGEIGAEGPGTLKPMIDLIRPTVGVVTLVRLEHKSAFRSLDAVMQEKGRLVEALPANGLAVLNHDDPRVACMAERTKARAVTFGQTGGDYVVTNVTCEALEALRLSIAHRGQSFAIATRFTGVQHSVAVAAAFTCTHQLGVAPKIIVERIASFQPLYGRCSVHRFENGPVFVLDICKGAEHSISLAFETIAKFPAPRKRIVLGQISDGAGSDRSYRRAYVAASAIADQVIFVGENSHRSKATAEDIAAAHFVRFANMAEAGAFLKETAVPGEIIFLKSATNMHLERLMLNFLTSVRCWKNDCGKRVSCVRQDIGGCGLYGVPFEQHRAARKEGLHLSPALPLG